MVIRVNGQTLGALNEWNPRINKTMTDLYEFGPVTGPYAHAPGEPFEVVPGNVSGMQIDIRRWDLYNGQLETAFLTPDVTMLSNQLSAFGLREVWTTPGNLNNFVRLYAGVWWQDIGRTIDAKGDRTINAGGTLRYTRRDKIAV
jgi:hypothetical protein